MTLLTPPDNGVTVRMYRQGHGDCFLLAFPRECGGAPVYVLIDCGYKPGSQKFLHKKPIGDIVDHIGAATDHRLDLMIVTHEHQDHVNGIWKKNNPYFQNFEIEEAWLAWTEDPTDSLANELRERHKDQLLSLVEARRKLALAASDRDPVVQRLDDLLALELGDDAEAVDQEAMGLALSDPTRSTNKQALKLVKDKASKHRGIQYLSPGGTPVPVADSAGFRAFVLGPPRSEDLLKDEDPTGTEAFPGDNGHGLSFAAASTSDPAQRRAPFSNQYCIPEAKALKHPFFQQRYGKASAVSASEAKEAQDDASWRRIDSEWLYASENLALKLNRGINNTSLVLAFELPNSKKTLLFAGDAQRGNWISWDDQVWTDPDDQAREITARDLLGRAVLYKVGHHGSHNATLAGTADDDYPNLGWMAVGAAGGELTAMITAVNEWAMTKNSPPWRHPLESIKHALEVKTQGRVLQTDVDLPEQPPEVPDNVWQAFLDRTVFDPLYFDLEILDA